jgi:hypothetical protein
MATYSFQDVVASITGVGGSFSLGSGAATSDEGITVTRNPKNGITIGADGAVMNSLYADSSGKISVSVLKTSPVNAQLQAMYDLQAVTSTTWGNNVIVIRESASGDVITATSVAFNKAADTKYAKDGGMNVWEFDAGNINTILGTYA